MASATRADQEKLVNAALADLEARHGETPIDAVIFTGDLAFSGETDEFALAQEILLAPVQERLGLERGQIIILPGNHDVDRTAITALSEAGLSAVLTDRSAVNKLLDSRPDRELAMARLERWDAFHAAYYEAADNVQNAGNIGFAHIINTAEGTLGIAALNTAWRSQGGSEDRGRILLGETQVTQTLAAVGECSSTVAALHHPIDWLAPFDADLARSQFEGGRLLVLTGHEHDADPTFTASVRGRCIYDRGGCLYESHDYRNAYALIDLTTRDPDVTITVREWYPAPRATFAESTRLADGGRITLALPGLSPTHHPHYSTIMDALADQVLDRSVLLEPRNSDAAIRVKDLLVSPVLYKVPHEQARATPSVRQNSEAFTVADPVALLESAQVVIVSGEHPDDGVTTSLIWLLSRYYEKNGDLLPILLQNGKPLGTNRADRALKSAAAEVGYATDGRPLPPLLMAVDDADDRPMPRLDRLAKYIAETSGNKYILGAHSDGHVALGEALAKRGVSVERVHVWPFGRRQLRALVSQIEGQEDEAIVEQVSSLLMSNRLPRSPFLMAALIAVLRSEGDLQVLNESSILAAYARFVLGATDLAESADHGQDFRGREYLLGCLAEELLDKPRHRITRAEAERFFAAYFASQSYARSPTAVLQDLINRRILIEVRDEVGFRQAAFLYLFAGSHMNEINHKKFKARMLAEPLRYPDVLRHAAGLGRNDPEILEQAADTLDQALAAVVQSIQPEVFDKLFETEERRKATLENLKKQLAVVITPLSADDDTHDRVHDIVLSADDGDDAEEESPTAVGVLIAALDLAGDVLKSSEFVKNATVKQETVRRIMSGHAVLGAATAGLESENHEIRDSLLQSLSTLGAQGVKVPKAEDVDHVLRALLVALVLGAAATSLASPHLRDAIEHLQQDAELSAAPGRALILATVAAVLELPGWTDGLTGLYDRFGEFPYLRELLRDMTTNMYRSTVQEAVARRLEGFLVDIYTTDGGDKSRTRTQLRQGRIRTQLAMRGVGPDELETAIDTLVADPAGGAGKV